jgi:SAM-dependent methyltransferase
VRPGAPRRADRSSFLQEILVTTRPDPRLLDDFLGKVVADLAASYAGVMVSLGDKLGLYKAMRDAGPLTPAELAQRASCHERYVREWLDSQAAGGYVRYDPAAATYELPPEQAAVLADEDSPVFFPPAWQVPASMWFDEHRTLDAFRSGRGVPWGDHDARLFCGVAAFFRNGYRAHLVSSWLPSLDGVREKLEAGATVADVGCGHGHSTLFMAEAFPRSRFVGIDTHAGSLRAARRHAADAGLADRVSFEQASADGYRARDLDLVCFFDCLHDLGRPDRAARHAREALAPDGTLMLVEPWADDRPERNHDAVGRLYYAASTALCCAHALSESPTHVLGAQAGLARLSGLLRDAGFGRVRLATRTPFNMVVEARP